MFQTIFHDPIWHAAAIAFARSTASSLIALLCLSIAIRRAVFGRQASSRTFLYAVGIGALIALGLAGFNQAAGVRARLDAPQCFPVDSQIVQAYLTSAALLAMVFLLVQMTMSLLASTRSKSKGLAGGGAPVSATGRRTITLPRGACILSVGALVALGSVTLIQSLFAKPYYDLNCIRAEVLLPTAISTWSIIHERSPTDFDRLTKHLGEYVTTPGTRQDVIDRAVDQTLNGYRAEFLPYLGALPDDLAKEYLAKRSAIAERVPPSYCAFYFGGGAKPANIKEIEAEHLEIEDFASMSTEALFVLKRAAAGKAMPAERVAKSDWKLLMRKMVGMGSENATMEYIYDSDRKDPSFCKEHAIFLRSLASLDTPTATDMRKALVGSMLTGTQWNWAAPR